VVTSWRALNEGLADALGRSDDAATERSIGQVLNRLAALDGATADIAPAATDVADPAPGAAGPVSCLALLRRNRRFDLVERVAEAVLQAGDSAGAVVHHYALALVERGAPAAALALMRGLLDDAARATPEARGLEGRACKELFLATDPGSSRRRRSYLSRAVDAYRAVYEADPEHLWHGINTAALLLRASREGIRLDAALDAGAAGRDIAAGVAAAVGRHEDGPWEWATAIEAEIALGRTDAALARLRRHPVGVGAFELASLRRQLVEVWQLNHATAPGAEILPPLEALLLTKPGAALTLAPGTGEAVARSDAAVAGFEKVFGSEGAQTQSWFEELLRRCRAVARIESRYEEAVGTGFVLAGADLHPSFPGRVLLTNAHVIPDAVAPDDARLTFRGLRTPDGTAALSVGRLLWTSPVSRFDATVLALPELPAGVEANALAAGPPPVAAVPPSRVYVIGHPLGAATVKISILDNELLDADATRLHYRAPTQPGSSGSPVFDAHWRVVALHHSGGDRLPRLTGGGVHAANEGLRLDAIREAVAAALAPPNGGAGALDSADPGGRR
jgi:S1-C subfamily serine protease